MMKRVIFATGALAATLALASCGHSDNANAPASADNVEMPAEEAMSGVSAAPVPDAAAHAGSDDAANAAQTDTAAADAASAAQQAAADVASGGEDASSSR